MGKLKSDGPWIHDLGAMVAVSNVLSLLTCFLELMFYSGTVWGFSFLEYIFKEEKIFEKEKCDNVDPEGKFRIFLLDCKVIR